MKSRLAARGVDVERVVRHRRRFLRFVERRVGSREDAEDILQTALANSLEQGGKLQREESLVAWFYRLLRNAIVDHHRRAGARRRAVGRLSHDPALEPGFDERVERNVCTCVLEELEDLKLDYAEILRRVEVGERPVSEVAKELGITAGTARVRLHRARQALRRRLELTCRTCVDHGCLDCTCRRAGRRADRRL